MRRFAAAVVLCLFAPAVRAQDAPDWSTIEIKVQKVAGSVYMLYGEGGFAGGNIGVSVGSDGIALVDDEFAPLVPKIEAALKGVSDQPVRFVLNTHFHGDHTHGNTVFGKKSTIIAHDNVRKRLVTDDTFEGRPGTKAPPEALPVITFDHQVSVHINGEEVRGLHVPAGHTDGDTVVYFTKSNVVHMGDDFFNGLYPFIDLENGGTVKGYVAAVEKVLGEVPDDVKIIPGHGPLAAKADLARYLAMLKETSAAVQAGIDKGQTVEQIVAARPLAKYDGWAWPFLNSDAFLKQIYNGLKGIAKNPS
jgi:glyoxylase-like metal-dependent hydrolase (beta-lactamase superfamily II)